MAITSVGTLGTAAEGASSDTTLALVTSATLEAGNVGVLAIASNNAGATGNTNIHTSVTDSGSNTYSKVYEHTYSPGGVEADGVTVSIWTVRPASDFASGGTVTMNQSANNAEKCASFWEYSAGAALQMAGTQQTEGANTNHPTSLTIGSLTSKEYLFFRVVGKEINTTTALTPTTNYTAITGTRSRNNAAAITIRGEFRILTGTGDTSAPTMNVISDTASIYVALEEVSSGTDAMTAAGITTGSPTLDAPTIGQVHVLTSTNITTAAPTLDAPTLGQTHVLTSTTITTGAPTLDAPTLAEASGTDALTAAGITTAAPTLDAPTIGQTHVLTSATITTGAPVLDAATLGQVHVLTGTTITTGAPTLDAPTAGQSHILTSTGITTGAPVMDAPTIGQVHVLTSTTITTAAPDVGAPAVGQVHVLTSTTITTASPDIGAPTLTAVGGTVTVTVVGMVELHLPALVVNAARTYHDPAALNLPDEPVNPVQDYHDPAKRTLRL